MFRKILVVTDIYADSLVMCRQLGRMKEVGTKECVLARVILAKEAVALGVSGEEKYLKAPLEKQKKALEKQGIKTSVEVLAGGAVPGIKEIAARKRCSLVVVGSERRSLASEMFLWSLSDVVIRNVSLPVLVMRLNRDEETGVLSPGRRSWTMRGNLLFPTDFSRNAGKAFSLLKKISAVGARRITLLHVQDSVKLSSHSDDRLEEFNRVDTERLDGMKSMLEGARSVRARIAYGNPGREILKAAEEEKADQIIMGSQGRGYIQELFLGSVSGQVARMSPVPVLLVPEKKR